MQSCCSPLWLAKCEFFCNLRGHFQLILLYGHFPSNSIANVDISCHFDCCLNRRNGFWICGNWFLLVFMSRQKSAVPNVYKMNALQIPILRWNTCPIHLYLIFCVWRYLVKLYIHWQTIWIFNFHGAKKICTLFPVFIATFISQTVF